VADKMNNILISVVSPVYRAEKILSLLASQVREELKKVTEDFEIILVEDGSPDNSWEAITVEAQKDRRIKGIKLSKNFGQHYAITAGLDHAKGKWIVVMDCDLQDKPTEIRRLYDKALEGYDIVLARRRSRKDNFLKRFYSKAFYRILGYLTGAKQDESIANFGIYNEKIIEAIRNMREPIRYFPTMVKWVGFRQTTIDVSHGEREIGRSAYNFRRMLRLAKDIILANSEKPIYAIVGIGLIVSLVSFIAGIILAVQYFLHKIEVAGYTSLILSIWFLSGVIIMILGVIGLYLGKTFEAVKGRPIYIIDKIVNDNENTKA
jgi:polyisoprenyl-phosphate glycosyltransferase